MSRIGKKEISIPSGVEIKIEATDLGQKISVKSSKGQLVRVVRPELELVLEGSTLKVLRKSEDRKARALHGLTRTLISNMVEGLTTGFKKELDIVGVGYRAILKGTDLDFQVGKSHPVVVKPPQGIVFTVQENNTRIIIEGYDKELIGQIAANIIAIRPPEPYKGKGIRVKGQHIRRKAGKSGSK
jgi:large subunit ribosomal protein L6